MRKNVLIPALGLLAVFSAGGPARSAGFTLCESTYALCTTAPCTPTGKDGALSCSCEVRSGYSAGQQSCQDLSKASDSTQLLRSRYYPVKSYAVCTNDRPWAWCLDKPCTVDKTDPSKANCACTTAKDQGPYVIVGDTNTPATCTTGIISSATVTGIDEITNFLKGTSKLKPYPIKVLQPPEPQQRSEIRSDERRPE